MKPLFSEPQHPQFTRRKAIQAGAIGLLGLGTNHLHALQAAGDVEPRKEPKAKSVIYIYLPGGLAQHDSFDPKPHAPDDVRGEFGTIATQTPGIQISEHLPLLAQRTNRWSMVRSLTHPNNEHWQGHMVMCSGRTMIPPGFQASKPQPTDWPSMAAIAGNAMRGRNNLPPAVILPETLMDYAGGTASGQFAGQMGRHCDPWVVKAVPFRGEKTYGAFPTYSFNHLTEAYVNTDHLKFGTPSLSLPEGVGNGRLKTRMNLLESIEHQRRHLDEAAAIGKFDHHRQAAVSLITSEKVKWAFDVASADAKTQDRYGRNSFGWSLLMARRLVDVGVSLVQINLGNLSTWDTHGANFPKLKDFLLPPTDMALSALLDDLHESGQLENTLIVMASEFGRTPKISRLPQFYKLPGRDHWGAVQSVFFAGGGVQGGRVIGSSDKIGAYPSSDVQRPENMAASIYNALGIPRTANWFDAVDRAHQVYHGSPIAGLT